MMRAGRAPIDRFDRLLGHRATQISRIRIFQYGEENCSRHV
jgi:hypothetical protein